ncbi:MAG: serine/threonine protein kinase [Polyangiaceae bacterium]|nr:serine/threonine protein kinase [Polyangiaceae bacterium]
MDDDDKTSKPTSGTRRSSTIRVADLAATAPALGGACPAPRSARPPSGPGGPQTMPAQRDPWAHRALAMGEILEDMEGRSYVVVGFLGRGGMGEVYEVEEAGSRRRLAVKCMRLTSIADPKTIERAKAEAVVLERLRHPNVIPVFAMGVRDDGLIWMVMKLLKGHTTGQIVAELGKVPIPWALMIARDVCFGLEAIHAFAIHRDIKPDNLYLDHDGQVVVLDIGAGKFYAHGLSTTNGYVIGTMAYMSPEQIVEPGKIDIRSDIFSTGIVLYQLLSGGEHPFMDEESLRDPRQAGASILHRPARPLREAAPWVPCYVDELTMRALCKEREGRYANTQRFAVVLDAALRRLEHDVGPLPPLRFLSADLARRKEERALAAAAAAAAAGVTAAGQGKPATSEVTKALRGELTQAEPAAQRPAADAAAAGDADWVLAATERVEIESLAGVIGVGRGEAPPTGKVGACELPEGSSPQHTERMSVLEIVAMLGDEVSTAAEPGFGAEGGASRPGAPSVEPGFGAEGGASRPGAPDVEPGFGAEGAPGGARPGAPDVEPDIEGEDISAAPAPRARSALRSFLDARPGWRWYWRRFLPAWYLLCLGAGVVLWSRNRAASPAPGEPAIPGARTSAPVPTSPAAPATLAAPASPAPVEASAPTPPPAAASASVAPPRSSSPARPARAPRARPAPSKTHGPNWEPPPGGRIPEF